MPMSVYPDSPNAPDEARKWHLSWIIAALIAFVVAGVAMGTGLEIPALVTIILSGLALAIALLWIWTPATQHVALKIRGSIMLLGLAIFALWWVNSFDRPILQPEIEGVKTQNFNGSSFALDVQTLIKNSGRQSSYADAWKLMLIVDGTRIEGKELYDQSASVAKDVDIYNQEFPPGKPVRGSLFFAFPAVAHDLAQKYFSCNSTLMDKVSLKLSVWDSKTKREWFRVRTLTDLAKEGCAPLDVPDGSSPPKAVKVSALESQPSPASTPAVPTAPTQSAPASAPQSHSVCSGTTLANCAQINNGQQIIYGYVPPPPRVMTPENAAKATSLLKTAPSRSRVHFIYVGSTDNKEINDFYNQVAGLFIDASDRWQIDGKDVVGTAIVTADGAISHGEGIGCSISNPTSAAGGIAKSALAATGFPCAHEAIPFGPRPSPADINISVGTRILPPQ